MKKVMGRQLKHQIVLERVRAEILGQGQLRPGQKIPTEQELAKSFGVSRPTVARALRELQQQGLISRRQGAGSFLSIQKPAATRKVGALMGFSQQTAQQGIFGTLFSELSHLCALNNYTFFMNNYPAGDDEQMVIKHARRTCETLIAQNVNAVMFIPVDVSERNAHINEDLAYMMDQAGIAVILIDRDIFQPPRRSKFDRVGINNELAAQALTQHLFESGCRKIDMVVCRDMPASVVERIDGYEKALLHNGITPSPDQIHRIDTHDLTTIEKCVQQIQADALVCINDEVAALMMRALLRKGVQIPEQMKIVGFDDLPIASYLPVPLTTMRQPVKEIALEAFRIMQNRLEDPTMIARDILLYSQLVVRESCGGRTSKPNL